MSKTLFICIAILAITSSSFAATSIVIGKFNDNNDGYMDWASPQPNISTLPAKYSFSTTGATEGSKALKLTAGTGWQQNLAIQSYKDTAIGYDAGGSKFVQGFLASKYLAVDVTFVTADWVKSNPTGTDDWAQIGMNIQGTGLSWEGMGRPDLDNGNPGFAGGWDARNFGAQQTRTMYWDIAYLHDGDLDNKEITATGQAGYINLIMETNSAGFTSGGVYYIDNIRFTDTPEPMTLGLLGLGGLLLRRRK